MSKTEEKIISRGYQPRSGKESSIYKIQQSATAAKKPKNDPGITGSIEGMKNIRVNGGLIIGVWDDAGITGTFGTPERIKVKGGIVTELAG